MNRVPIAVLREVAEMLREKTGLEGVLGFTLHGHVREHTTMTIKAFAPESVVQGLAEILRKYAIVG